MKKLVFLCIAACCLFGCQNAEKKAKQHGEAQIVQENGEKLTVEVELVNGKLRDVDIDETVEGKKQTKKELKEDYQMKQASSIGKEWYEQVAFFENYVEKKGIKDSLMRKEKQPMMMYEAAVRLRLMGLSKESKKRLKTLRNRKKCTLFGFLHVLGQLLKRDFH